MDTLQVDWRWIFVRRLHTIHGVHNYAPDDLAAAVAFLTQEDDKLPFAELVTRSFELADAEAAFRYAIESRAPRVAVRP